MAQVAPAISELRPLDGIPISPTKGGHAAEETENNKSQSHDAAAKSEHIAAFDLAENFAVKHPLLNKWTLWYTKPPSRRGENAWADSLKEVVTFDLVEEFWGVYNNITKVSDLALKSDYRLFKAGVRPEWEDPQNKLGGKWAYQFKNKARVAIDELWLHVMLAAIGETLEKEGDSEVMGVVVNVRKGYYRIGLWTRTVDGVIRTEPNPRTMEEGKETLLEIGRRFKEVLRLPSGELVKFSEHIGDAHGGSARAKAKFTV